MKTYLCTTLYSAVTVYINPNTPDTPLTLKNIGKLVLQYLI